jgi:outer membrane beta-barrel protein
MKKLLLVIMCLISTLSMAAEKSLYDFSWLDRDKEVYVLQNRKFRKDGKVYVGATAEYLLNGAFINSYGGAFRAGYFFNEDWGIELIYGKNTGSENDTAKGVREQSTVPFYRKVDTYAGGMLMWSPFYSKINTFNKIFYFDWMFGAGVAQIQTKDNRNLFDTASQNRNTLVDESQIGGIWNTGFRFYLSDHWSLRLDLTGLAYSADKTKRQGQSGSTSKATKLFSTTDLGLGLNYQF